MTKEHQSKEERAKIDKPENNKRPENHAGCFQPQTLLTDLQQQVGNRAVQLILAQPRDSKRTELGDEESSSEQLRPEGLGDEVVESTDASALQLQRSPGLPRRPPQKDVQAAATLYEYLVGSLGQRSSLRQKMRVVRRCLHPSRPDAWLRGVERSYNHRPPYDMYLILNFKGTPYEYGLWDRKGELPGRISPLREDLRAALGDHASKYVAGLERATRLTPLSGKEIAAAILTPTQRKIAIERAKGEYRVLAQWLFDDRTWTYLINSAEWAPYRLGGFFEHPDRTERIDWPKGIQDWRNGDKVYLQGIMRNIVNVQTAVDKLRAESCGPGRFAGWFSAPASKGYQWATGLKIMEYREKLQLLRQETAPGIEKVIPLKVIWEPAPTTRSICH